MKKIKVMTVFGTRPEAIKMAPVVLELKKYPDLITPIVAVTAQHRDMLDQVLNLFNIKPDYDLNIMAQGQTLFDITTKAMNGLNEVLSKEKPDIVLVALGIPLQEKLIYKHLNKFDKGIFVGVGGSFDVISGHKKRAPKIFIKLNLEWLYRILKEPKRLKRFYDSNVKFLFKVKKYK